VAADRQARLLDEREQRVVALVVVVGEADLGRELRELQRLGAEPRDPTPGSAVMVPMAALTTGEALGMWIMGGVFERFPQLKVVFVEPGLGWIAWWLFITDDMVTRQGYELPAITELPSFYFHRNVFVTFIDETDAITAPQLRNRIGIENMMWSSDYPHPVTSWPNSQQVVADTLGVLSDTERELVVAGNARRVWNL
jgi:predicted TIM-barrel fold metal-dependent hydrolase